MSSTTPESRADPKPGLQHGAYPIPLGSLTTAGFIGRTERGPINEPVCVTSFPEYSRYFGGYLADGAVAHAVNDYFLHGGRRAVIVRVANRARRAALDVPAADGLLRLEARYPGRNEVLRASIDYEQAELDTAVFNLVVQRVSASGNRVVEDQEIYPLVSTRESDPRFVARVLRDSRLVALAGPVPAQRPLATPPARPGDPVRYVNLTIPGDDGDALTDYDLIGSDRDGTGLFAFARGPRIDLLAIPLLPELELGTTAFVAAARYCQRQRALLIWDPPASWQSVDSAMLGSRRLESALGSVMTYFPRIRPRGARLRHSGGLPACGAIAGMLAARDQRGIFGRDEDADYTLRAALTPVIALGTLEAQRLARYGINAFVQATGGLTRLVGRVTLAGRALHRRRLWAFVLNSIETAALDGIADHDQDGAIDRAEWQLRRFLDELLRHGALRGATASQAYFVEARRGTDGFVPGLRFGIALDEPGRFVEYTVDLAGERAARVHRARGIEAEQLLR
jgi:hypothetical protein